MRLSGLLISFALIQVSALAQTASQVGAPLDLANYAYHGIVSAKATPHNPAPLEGVIDVAVELTDPPLVVIVGANAKQNITMSADEQRAYLAQLSQKQDAIMSQLQSIGGVEIGRVSKGYNAVMVSLDAGMIDSVQAMSGVRAVRRLGSSRPMVDSATEAYIGAKALQKTGLTGAGIRVAMLDLGIDYTHINLGGSGNVADYNAAVAVKSGTPPANLFPNKKVIGGFDFVGDCPATPCSIAPDPNPIEVADQTGFGHGTHTADIVAGKSPDGSTDGTAPGAQLYAVKVCNNTFGCPNSAILRGLDFALDPTNSGTVNNAVDVINMSLGRPFGQREDSVTPSITNLVNFGVVCVIAAGNGGDIPYVLDSSSSVPESISVGATVDVSASSLPLVINSPASIAGAYAKTETFSFAPVTTTITGNIVFVGRGCPAGSIDGMNPDDPYLANPSGKIALIDRGGCYVSLKIDRAANNGAIAVLIGLVAPGLFTFSQGGGSHFVPSLVISQDMATLIKNTLLSSTVNATMSANNTIPLAGNVDDYSSRGTTMSYNLLKPDLTSPGTVTAAEVGTGNGQASGAGTSFSAPLVAGSAALLLSGNRALTPVDVKAILMETTETSVFNGIDGLPGSLASLSRMGAGELRLDRAVAASTSAWDASNPLAVSLSFGTYRLNVRQSFTKKIVVRNYSSADRTYLITNTYRNAPNTSGVTISTPPSIFVPANGASNFTAVLTVDPANLPTWTLNGGSNGSNGELLDTVEYAGFLNFISGSESVHLPWHILPHKAANVLPTTSSLALNGNPATLTLTNTNGATAGMVNVFSLVGKGVQFPASSFPAPGFNRVAINLQYAGIRLVCTANCSSASPTWNVEFAVSTFGQRSTPEFPAEFDIRLDIDNDGRTDLTVYNQDIGCVDNNCTDLTTATGQNGVFVYDQAAGINNGPFSFVSADFNSSNAILSVPLSALQTASGKKLNLNTQFTVRFDAADNYFRFANTDRIGPLQYELDMPKFYAGTTSLSVPPNGSASITVFPNNAATPFLTGPYNGKSPSQTGLLLMYTDGKSGQEASAVTVLP